MTKLHEFIAWLFIASIVANIAVLIFCEKKWWMLAQAVMLALLAVLKLTHKP